MVAQRHTFSGGFAVFAAVVLLSLAIVSFLGFNFASAGAAADATTFGITQTSQDISVAEGADASVYAVPDASAMGATAQRDVSAGVQEIQAEEEAARLAAEQAKAAAEQRSIQQAADARAKYLSIYGSLPAGDVDFSIGREAFIAKWTERINDYLEGFPLAGHGETFAEAAWEYGVDPRWSPAISNTESTRGTVCFNPHNAWGWGSSSWSSWDQAIIAHVKGLSEVYGFTISYNYAKIYCPPNYDNWYRDTLNEMVKI